MTTSQAAGGETAGEAAAALETRTLVFGDDGSPSSDVAFGWIDNQSWAGWRLEVLYADEPPYGTPVPAEEAAPHPWTPPQPRVPSAAGFVEVRHLLARADPRVALMQPADLVVVAPHGRGPARRRALNLGSVSEWLLSHPAAPTLIARASQTVRSILIAHDGSASASLALDTVISLPLSKGADITIVVVDDGRTDTITSRDTALAHARLRDRDASASVVRGRPTNALCEAIDYHQPDLVVVGTRGLTGLRRLYLGSTAGAIARSAPGSVLVACAESDADDGGPS